jgi:hypothetical protein
VETARLLANTIASGWLVTSDWWKFQAVFFPVKVCEKIPTLGTQLRVLSTVKANLIASGWLVTSDWWKLQAVFYL